MPAWLSAMKFWLFFIFSSMTELIAEPMASTARGFDVEFVLKLCTPGLELVLGLARLKSSGSSSRVTGQILLE